MTSVSALVETDHTAAVEPMLVAAAFGNQSGRWPLPMATTPHQLWLRAVAAGGQGHYGSAYCDLAVLRRSASAGRLASLAHSTHGSFLRQLGWHSLARGWDGRALVLAGADSEARADALIGLAADALGVGRLAAAATLLARVDSALAPAQLPAQVADRLMVRRCWVAAELAMAVGDGATAVRHAKEAVELAQGGRVVSVRHQVKSDVVLAAALCSVATERARAVAEAALAATGRLGLIPLSWALACLLLDIGSVTFSGPELSELRGFCADQVRHAGGTWRNT
ncbi:hypothetical protein MLPF_0578 [Mycobacterium lepromatosis]|uniref:Uncharacterized protein n=1 Tax=Mycobacterium lepromatosis TaxID=480418 RepID=A0A0F4ERZ2_9MYCO|nr:hypothetical protein MLPM_0383 [Mycobacterium lepromatosis]UKN41751.1 hypothetical protein MLPF_0578 [Mycobacterium lepromatosis]